MLKEASNSQNQPPEDANEMQDNQGVRKLLGRKSTHNPNFAVPSGLDTIMQHYDQGSDQLHVADFNPFAPIIEKPKLLFEEGADRQQSFAKKLVDKKADSKNNLSQDELQNDQSISTSGGTQQPSLSPNAAAQLLVMQQTQNNEDDSRLE